MPNDWVEKRKEDGKKGSNSSRMKEQGGNIRKRECV